MKERKKKVNWYDKKHFLINIGVFDTHVGVYIDYSYNEMVKHLKKISYPHLYEEFIRNYGEKDETPINVQGQMYKMGGGYILRMKVNEEHSFREFMGTVVHEISHVSHYLCRTRRIPLTEDSEEVYCYLVGFLTVELLRQLYE